MVEDQQRRSLKSRNAATDEVTGWKSGSKRKNIE